MNLNFDPPPKKRQGAESTPGQLGLNPRYTFDAFVVGDSNRFAHAAALAVAEAPGKTKFNPLYIYGGAGLGKTHLVQAIGHFAKEEYEDIKVLYVTSEKFTNDFINSITSNTMQDFDNLYRNVDVLLLDDIQFFTGKESTQVQLFNTFNVLYQNGKQIVLTSDRPPREIKGVEERLLSRFQHGLVTGIQPPDLETRIAILSQKVKSDGVSLPIEVAAFIAENVTSNIMELEGSLVRLLAYASLYSRELTVSLAKEVLSEDPKGASMKTVFISYAREDFRTAKKLFMALKDAGYRPWLDRESLVGGQKWKPTISKAIRANRFFIALLSRNSVSKRGYVQKEIREALEVLDEFPDSSIFVIPVRLEECSPSHEKLEDLHWVDLFPSWKRGVAELLHAMRVASSR